MSIGAKALHITSRGLVVRAGRAPKLSQPAFDPKGKRVGSVSDVFGPVKSPYAVIKPVSGISRADLEKLVGSRIILEEGYGKGRKTKSVSRMRKH